MIFVVHFFISLNEYRFLFGVSRAGGGLILIDYVRGVVL